MFTGKNIFVTGGTGSIGSFLVKELLKFNVNNIVVLSRDDVKQFLMKKYIEDNRLEFFIGDVRNRSTLENIFSKYNFDIVYHAAAMKHVIVCERNPVESVFTNILGTDNIVNVARKYSVPKLINISTDKAVNPNNVMGATKFISERIVLNANYTSVRFGNVVCSRGSVIPALLEEIIRNKRLTITDPNVTRYIMEIPDAVRLILHATEHADGGEIFILKMKAFRLSDLVDVLLDRAKTRLKIESEIKLNITGLVHGEKLHEELINESEIPYLHELEKFYVIKPKYPPTNKRKEGLTLSSKDAEIVSKDELAKIVDRFIDTYLPSFFMN